jgi:hypothetical protein
MKMKNAQLGLAIASMDTLKGLVLEGDIALAAVKMRKQLQNKFDEIEEAKKNVIESLCTKDENGKAEQNIITEKGFQYASYKFESEEISKKCGLEIDKILSGEAEIESGKIMEGRLLTIKCSAEQMEALLLLIPTA